MNNRKMSKRGRKPVHEETAELLQNFFLRVDVSKQAPGRKDFKKVGHEIVQKRHLYMSVNEAFSLFAEERGSRIGRSKFASFRPAHVLPLDDMPHNVCVCSIHENINNLIGALSAGSSSLPKNGRQLIEKCVCS